MATIINPLDTELQSEARTTSILLPSDFQVDTPNIVDGAITALKIGDASITAAKIASAAITNAKITDATIETLKLKNGAVSETSIIFTNKSYIFDVTRTSASLPAKKINYCDYIYFNIPNLSGITPDTFIVAQMPFWWGTWGIDRTVTFNTYLEVDSAPIGSASWTTYQPATIISGFQIYMRRNVGMTVQNIDGNGYAITVPLVFGGAMTANKSYRLRVGFSMALDVFEATYFAANTHKMSLGPMVNYVVQTIYK